MSELVVTTAALTTPVSLTNVKNYLKIDYSTDDTLITSLIEAARDYTEAYLGSTLITTEYTYYTDKFSYIMRIPLGPVQSIDSVKYYNTAGTLTTLSTDDYSASGDKRRIIVTDIPTLEDDRLSAVQIAFTAGYSDTESSVPDIIKTAIYEMIAYWYEIREDTTDIPVRAISLLRPYRQEVVV